MQILTWGAESRRVEDLADAVATRKISRILDVRIAPAHRGRDTSWTPEALRRALGEVYHWVPDLATKTPAHYLEKGTPPAIPHLHRGIAYIAANWIEDPVWLFLGEPEDPARCGRKWLADRLGAELRFPVEHLRAVAPAVATQGALL